MKKVLVAFEESQTTTIAFRRLGFLAYSNDLQDCSGGYPEWHLKMDIFKALNWEKWDLIIMHPPCTAIAISGNSTYAKGKPKEKERIDAVKWTQKVWNHATKICDYVAMENPVGCLNTVGDFPKPQYIQPYEFGHTESKKTGLWLYNLPKLKPTKLMKPPNNGKRWSNQTPSGQNKLGPSPERGKLRSKTYKGVADAFAKQWGEFIIKSARSLYIL